MTTERAEMTEATVAGRPDGITTVGWGAIIVSLAYVAWMATNAWLEREHLPPSHDIAALLFVIPALLLWLGLVAPALELLALKARGRRRLVAACYVVIGVPVCLIAVGLLGGIIAMLAGASQWPPEGWVIPYGRFLFPSVRTIHSIALLIGTPVAALRVLKAPETVRAFRAGLAGEP